jgi:molecular chaperone DnaK (HSP70)
MLVDGKKDLCSAIRPQTTIAPRDLCVAAITRKSQGDANEYNVVIIPAAAKLPYEATEYFTPIEASTSAVNVRLFDSHAGELSKNCTPLQEVEVQVQPTDEANNTDRFELKIHMDGEGLVHIEARDKLLNKPVPIKFKFDTGLSESDVAEARKQLLARHSKPGL